MNIVKNSAAEETNISLRVFFLKERAEWNQVLSSAEQKHNLK